MTFATELTADSPVLWPDPGVAVVERAQPPTTPSILQAAETFIAHTPSSHAAFPTLSPHSRTQLSAAGQWLVRVIGQFLGQPHVGIAAMTSKAHIPRPLADVGLSPIERWQWWMCVQQSPIGASLPLDDARRLTAGEVLSRAWHYGDHHADTQPTILVAPILMGQHLIGILGVEVEDERMATGETLVLLRAVAKLAAQALECEQLAREVPRLSHRAGAAESDNRQMKIMLSQTCHELKTPLTTIKTSVQLAERKIRRLREAGQLPQMVDESLAHVDHLLVMAGRDINQEDHLINDLLDLARMQVGKLEVTPSPCDITTLVRDVVESHRLTWQDRVIRLDAPPEAVVVSGDPYRLVQVVGNFLTNALKYSPADRPVEVQVQVDQPYARVAIRDYGEGLSKQELKRIWERFYRVKGGTVHNGSGVGLGLGLSISRMIVQLSHGKVGVTSSPGEGSTFWFAIPLLAASRS
jgi:signal transduction histidine kinase